MTEKSNSVIEPLQMQPGEIEILIDKEKLSMDVWAEENYIIAEQTGAAMPGPWSNYYSPFLVEPMQRLSAIGECQVTIMSCSQWGKSVLSSIFIGHTVDQNPVSMLIVMPTETDANERINIIVRPTFKAIPKLLKHLVPPRPESLNSGKETVLDNMPLFIGWAGSPAALSDKAIGNLILDEVGKYPARSGREADPVSLAKKRQRTFKGRWKRLVISTPVLDDDLIHAEFKKGDMCQWWVKCPHCNDWHELSWWNVQIDKKETGEFYEHEYYADGKHSRYVCPDCGALWSEQDRWLAASGGMWCPYGNKVIGGKLEDVREDRKHYSYQGQALMIAPMFCTVSDLVADWVSANNSKKAGDIQPLKDFYNSQLGLPWKEIQKKTQEQLIITHKGLHKNGFVPDYVQLVTQAVDVQKNHFRVQAVGWGYLYRSAIIYNARIETGDTENIESWKVLEEFLKMTYPRMDKPDEKLAPIVTGIDCGFNFDVAMNFCRKITWALVIPVKGDDHVRGIYSRNDKDYKPLSLYNLNVNEIKSTVFELLHRSQTPGPGYMQVPADIEYITIQELCSEQQIIEKNKSRKIYRWIPKNESHPNNHAWDLAVYNKALADIKDVRMLRDPNVPEPKRKMTVEKNVESDRPITTNY
jgi:phage terminase large subunit GpA-like protein